MLPMLCNKCNVMYQTSDDSDDVPTNITITSSHDNLCYNVHIRPT